MSFWHVIIVLASFSAGIFSPSLSSFFQENTTPLGQRNLGETQSTATILTCNKDTLAEYLHDEPVPGLHVVCWQDDQLKFYRGAQVGEPSASVAAPGLLSWNALRSQLVEHLQLSPFDDVHQPWAAYTPYGVKARTEVDDDDSNIESLKGMFLVFQGGQWVWPGVRKGFIRTIQLSDGRNATLETVSLHPLVLSTQHFLSPEECTKIQDTATPSLQYSQVSLMDKDKGRPASDFRTSQTTFLQSNENAFLKEIEERTSSLVRLPVSHQEHVQVLRYGKTEKYDSHHDYFNPALYQQDKRTLDLIGNGLRNRMITVFWYLSDVPAGGETAFPSFDKKSIPADKHCDEDSGGLLVKPQEGKVIIFYSQTPDGAMDEYSLHGACPVKEGIKWAANKWVWNAPMAYIQS